MSFLRILIVACISIGCVHAAEPEQEARSLADIHKQVRTQEKSVAKAKTDEEKAKNISVLCALFVEIGQHPDLTDSATLQSLSVRLRSRLSGIEKRTLQELRRRKIPEPQSMIDETKAFNRSRYIASRGGATNRVQGSSNDSLANDRSRQSSTSTGGQSEESSSGNVGKNGLAGNAAPGGLPDYGWGLVDLIRKTIRPEYWAVSGGPGQAIYFGPSRAIVIHGSWTVQEDVAELLTALRGG